MVVEAEELGGGEGFGHKDGGGSKAATDVGDLATTTEFFFDAAQGGKPFRDQASEIAGAEEALCAVKEVGVMFMPADPVTGTEGLFDTIGVVEAGGDDLEGAGDEGGAVFDGEGEGLLGGQRESLVARVVQNIAAGGVCVEPLADVALGSVGFAG